MLPNFLLVGATKAGTTSFASMLGEHPDIFMCPLKETHFFSYNWHRGLKWYESLFADARGEKCVGEASPSYAEFPDSPEAPKRILQCLGDIKYLYIIRHPVDRIISDFAHVRRHRWIPDRWSLEHAIQQHPSLRTRSLYNMQMARYLQFAGPDQWHVVILEELAADPERVQRDVYAFLGIDERWSSSIREENIASDRKRYPVMVSRLTNLRYWLPKGLIKPARRLASAVGSAPRDVEISAATRHQLLESLLDDMDSMSLRLGKDLRAIWNIEV